MHCYRCTKLCKGKRTRSTLNPLRFNRFNALPQKESPNWALNRSCVKSERRSLPQNHRVASSTHIVVSIALEPFRFCVAIRASPSLRDTEKGRAQKIAQPTCQQDFHASRKIQSRWVRVYSYDQYSWKLKILWATLGWVWACFWPNGLTAGPILDRNFGPRP